MMFSNELNFNHLSGVEVSVQGPMEPYDIEYNLLYIENFDTHLKIQTTIKSSLSQGENIKIDFTQPIHDRYGQKLKTSGIKGELFK